MPANLITDPLSQGVYFDEYLSHVNRYKDQVRRGIFVRYYNVNRSLDNESPTNSVLKITDLYYDIYEYTPTWAVDEITDVAEADDSGKFKFEGTTSVTIYTIEYPAIHDMISFSYAPYTSNHVFRVKGISASLREKDKGIQIYKLDLEYANDVDFLESLNISNHFVYSMFDEKYKTLSDYTRVNKEQTLIQSVLDNIQTTFSDYYELYASDVAAVDVYSNYQLYVRLTTLKNIQQYFTAKVPYGVGQYSGASAGSVLTASTSVVVPGTPLVHTVPADILNYVYSPTTVMSDVIVLLDRFTG